METQKMMKIVKTLFVINFLCFEILGQKELRLLSLLPMTGNGWTGGPACLPALQMAVKDVNANENILKNYNLTYTWIDSKCNPGTAVYKMFKILNNDPVHVMIIGDGCSIVSEATAQVTHLWNLTQLAYGSASPVLSDRSRFPTFFRLSIPEQKLNTARIGLMKEFNWKKVATINQALEFFSAVIDNFVKRVRGTEIDIISQEIFSEDPIARVQNLKDRDARIIVTAMYEDKARTVICSAYKVGLYGPKIIWVFVTWYSANFWKIKLDNLDCTEEEMSQVVEGSFLTGQVTQNPVQERGVANITVSEFDERFYNHPTYNGDTKNYNFISHLCYDTIWVAATALECAERRLYHLGYQKTLDNFTYEDSEINDIILECMSNTSYKGVTGNVLFTNGDPDSMMKVERIQDGERVPVAYYRQDKNPKYFEWLQDGIRWKDNTIPRDSTLITYEELQIPWTLYVIMTSFGVIGNCLSVCLFVFNIFYRNNSYVKLSSPNINNVLLFGCVLCYSTVFFKTLAVSSTVCKARIICFSLGFTLTFGALFSKTWRVYRIFTNKKLLRRTIKDSQLLAIIGGFAGIVVVVLVLWETLGPHRMETKFLKKEIYMNGNDAEVHPYVRVCESDYSVYFGWALYIIQGVLLSFGAFLAWETRNVKIQALNDSQQIGLCVYNVVILSAVGLTLSLLLEDEEVLMYGVTSGCLIIGTLLTQNVIFIPKMQAIRNKVSGNDLATSVGIRTGINNTSTGRTFMLHTSTLQSVEENKEK